MARAQFGSLDSILLAIVARLIDQIQGIPFLESGVTIDDDASGQPIVNIGFPDPAWVGKTLTVNGTNGTDSGTILLVGIGSVTLTTNLVHEQPNGSPFAVTGGIVENSPFANEANCYLGPDDLINPQANAGDFIFIVSPGSGEFDQGLWEGGGTAQAGVDGDFTVTIYSVATTLTDEIGHTASQITDATTGLVVAWKAVLAALANWDPLNSNGDAQTRNPISPRAFRTEKGDGKRMARMAQEFNLEWDQAIP